MITLSNVSFRYNKKVQLFSNLNLAMVPGGIYGLLGKNGVGKTTLLKIIAGIIFAQKGTIQIFGFNPQKRNPRMLADLFFLPEEFGLPAISIDSYLRRFACFYSGFDQAAFTNYLKEFGLTANDKLSALSYGQKKKFLIAFGLASRTRLLIMDEPTNGLDIPSKTIFRKLIASIADSDRIILISTHQIRDLENLIDPVIILNDGEIVLNESIESITKTITTAVVSDAALTTKAIYCEKNMAGFAVALKKDESIDGNVDLEILFNATIGNPEVMADMFKKSEGAV